jgi:hypothetical protein
MQTWIVEMRRNDTKHLPWLRHVGIVVDLNSYRDA